jgi:hypothetical protein
MAWFLKPEVKKIDSMCSPLKQQGETLTKEIIDDYRNNKLIMLLMDSSCHI